MTTEEPDEGVSQAGSPGSPGYVLNYTDAGEPILIEQLDDIYARIRHALVVQDKKPFEDSASNFGDCSRLSGTHILKALNKNAQDHVLSFPQTDDPDRRLRMFPSMSATYGKYARIIYQPISVVGFEGSHSLLDHIRSPNQLSQRALASFVAAFSQESLDAVIAGEMLDKTSVAILHNENFPIVYVPDGEGGDLQLTPISPLEVFTRFRKEVLFEKDEGTTVNVTRQEVSLKMQNISTAIGGDRMRFMAQFPTPLSYSQAGIYRYLHGGPIPTIASAEFTLMLERFEAFQKSRSQHQDGLPGSYFNADMEKGSMRLACWILAEARDWISQINEAAAEIDADFAPPQIDMVQFLQRSYRGNSTEREAIRAALMGIVFTRAMKQEGF